MSLDKRLKQFMSLAAAGLLSSCAHPTSSPFTSPLLHQAANNAAMRGNAAGAALLQLTSMAAQNDYNRNVAMDAAVEGRSDPVVVYNQPQPSNLKLPPKIKGTSYEVDQFAVRDGELGMLIKYHLDVQRGADKDIEVYIRFFYKNEVPIKDKDGKFVNYAGQVTARGPDIKPPYDGIRIDSEVFMPWSQLDDTDLPNDIYYKIMSFERLPDNKLMPVHEDYLGQFRVWVHTDIQEMFKSVKEKK